MLLAFICMNVLCCRCRRRRRSVLQERRCHRLIERASERSRETHTHTKPSVSNSSRCTITILCYTHTSCSNAKPLTTTRMARWRTIHDASKALSSSSSKLTNDPAISMDLAIYPLANLCLYACDGSSAAAASNKWSPSFCALQGTTTYIHLRRIDYLRTTAITTRHSQGCQAGALSSTTTTATMPRAIVMVMMMKRTTTAATTTTKSARLLSTRRRWQQVSSSIKQASDRCEYTASAARCNDDRQQVIPKRSNRDIDKE